MADRNATRTDHSVRAASKILRFLKFKICMSDGGRLLCQDKNTDTPRGVSNSYHAEMFRPRIERVAGDFSPLVLLQHVAPYERGRTGLAGFFASAHRQNFVLFYLRFSSCRPSRARLQCLSIPAHHRMRCATLTMLHQLRTGRASSSAGNATCALEGKTWKNQQQRSLGL